MGRRIIRGATIVTPQATKIADIAILDDVIEAVDSELPGDGEVLDARGLHLLPAVIDIHVHFNEPGRTEWEGAATGSRAVAAGGGAAYFDMPLNSTPCTVNAYEFQRKRTALEASSITDFALWGGLVPSSLDHMEELVEWRDWLQSLYVRFRFARVSSRRLRHLAEGARKGGQTWRANRCSRREPRPDLQTLERIQSAGKDLGQRFPRFQAGFRQVDAIVQASALAGEAGAKLHIVHVSSGTGVVAAAEARSRGVDVSIETCGHYLFFTEEDIERLGAIAKCTPPIRDGQQQGHLWELIESGVIDAVVSDHSPSPMSMKTADFWSAWGGIAGVQSTLAVMLDRGYHERGLSLNRIADLTAGWPAARFGLQKMGGIAPGNLANLTLIDLKKRQTLQTEDLQQRHKFSPYLGYDFRGSVIETIRRGETIFRDGQITATTSGKLLSPRGKTNV